MRQRGGGGWRWHGCLGKYPSTYLTIYLFKIYLRVDEPTPYHTHSHELGILYLSKSVYWLYQQQRQFYVCFSNFCRSVISLHHFKKTCPFKKKGNWDFLDTTCFFFLFFLQVILNCNKWKAMHVKKYGSCFKNS